MVSPLPARVPERARTLWENGTGDDRIRVGELWVLSWDAETVGLSVIAAVRDGYVVVWPVTLPGETSFAPGLVLEQSPLEVSVTMWPTRETGIGNHLLDRSLGKLIDPERIHAIADALEEGNDPGFPFATSSAWDRENAAADRAFVERWTELCFNTGGVEHDMLLDAARVQSAGASSRMTAQLLDLGPQQLRPIWDGVVPIRESQLSILAESLDVAPETLLRPDPLASVVSRLASPKFKPAVNETISATGWTEAAVRNAVRHEFTLAARDDANSHEVVDRKLADAIARVGR